MAMTALVVFLTTAWARVHLLHFQNLPPNQLEFLPRLAKAPYVGTSFITNSYAAPFAWTTRGWGYMDPHFKPGNVQLGEKGFLIQRSSDNYLWMADGKTNGSYLRPDYYLETVNQNLHVETARICNHFKKGEHDPKYQAAFRAGLTGPATLDHRLVSFDPTEMNRWSIVKLDWDFPPYLARLPGMNDDDRVGIRMERSTNGAIVKVSCKYQQQDNVPEGKSIVRLYVSRTPGSRELLAETMQRDEFVLPGDLEGNLQASVTPCSASKTGKEYFSNWIPVGNVSSFAPPHLESRPYIETSADGRTIRVHYSYGHEHHEAEANSTIRLYLQRNDGGFILLLEKDGVDDVSLPELPKEVHDDPNAQIRATVTPRTRYSAGREYLAAQTFPASECPTSNVATGPLGQKAIMAIKQKRGPATTLIFTADNERAFLEYPTVPFKAKLQMHALGQDGSFHLIRELIDERTFVIETGVYHTVRITSFSQPSEDECASRKCAARTAIVNPAGSVSWLA